MTIPALLKRIGVFVAGLLLVLGAVAFGPPLFRRDRVRFRWAGGMGRGVLGAPLGVAYGNGRLYVTDAGADRIVVFDTSGAVLESWDGASLGLGRPMHVTRGADGLLYVAEYARDRISVLDSGGRLVRRVGGTPGKGPDALDAPGGVTARGDTVYVADFYNHRVQAFSPSGATRIGRPGRLWAGRLHYPTDVATDDSLLYVADAYNSRIQVFRPHGEYVRRWGGPFGLGVWGPLRGWFRVASGLAVAGGRVYVADFYNNRIQVFTDRGRYLGEASDSLSLPTAVAIGSRGELFVADFGHRRIVRLVPTR
jgi:DNA-binding beta-propeller fold protein YncE